MTVQQPAASSLSSIGRTQRSQLVREQLERAVRDGEFPPGSRLPSERELVETFGVSRVTVREAISVLEGLGMVEVRHGRGCFVTQAPSDAYLDSFAARLKAHADEVEEMLMVRGALDALAARLAAERGSGEALEQVRSANAAFAAAIERDAGVHELAPLDVDFHQAIGSASGSPLLERLLRELHGMLIESRLVTLADRPKGSERDHEAIVDALLARDPGAATGAVAAHVRNVSKAVARLAEKEDE